VSAHRYWRVTARGLPGGFSLSELALAATGAALDGLLTPASDVAPVSGSLDSLVDGSAASAVVFGVQEVQFKYDLGASHQVDNLIVGSGPSGDVPDLGLAWSDDDVVYVGEREYFAPLYPGPNSFVEQGDGSSWNKQITFNSSVSIDSGNPSVARPSSYTVVGQVVDRAEGKKLVEFVWLESTGSNQYTGFGNEQYSKNYYTSVPGSAPGGSNMDASYRLQDGQRYSNGGFTSYGAPFAVGDVIGMGVDFDARTVTMYKNGVSQGVFHDMLPTGPIYPVVFNTGSSPTSVQLRVGNPLFPIDGYTDWAPSLALKSRGWRVDGTAFMSSWPSTFRQQPWDGFASAMKEVAIMTQGGGPLNAIPYTGAPGQPFYPPSWEYGRGFIANTVKKKGDPVNLPLRRKVRCYRETDGVMVGETFSDAAGNYRFDWLLTAYKYTVVSYDYEHTFRAAVADNLSPELMT